MQSLTLMQMPTSSAMMYQYAASLLRLSYRHTCSHYSQRYYVRYNAVYTAMTQLQSCCRHSSDVGTSEANKGRPIVPLPLTA